MPRARSESERLQARLDDLVRFTLALPEVVESTSYGQPALKRGAKLIFALRGETGTLSLACDFEERARLVAEHPDTFLVTDHYLNWPAVIVDLRNADKAVVRRAVKTSWERAGALAAKKRKAPDARPTRRRN